MTQPSGPEPERGHAAKVLQESLTGNWTTQAIYVTAELGLADLLAVQPRTSTELATLTATHEPSLRRLLRALIAIGVLAEGPGDTHVLTAVGSLLRSDAPDSMRSWA